MDYIYSYQDSGLKIVVLLDKQFKTNNGVTFLEAVQTELLNRYSVDELRSKPVSEFKGFKEILAQQMTKFNANFNDPLAIQKSKVANLEQLVVENYNNTLNRTTEIDDIKNQVQLLSDNSTRIKTNAIKLRKATERQYYFLYAVGGFAVLVS